MEIKARSLYPSLAPASVSLHHFVMIDAVISNNFSMDTTTAPPAPLAPSICEPVPRPTPKPVTYLSPAPTTCDEQRFFFINGVCTNDMFLLGGTAYISAVECCNVYYGTGSLYDGNCLYVDTCNTYFYTYTNPPSSGSTPTVSTEVTGPPTLPDRRSGGTT